MDAVAKNFRYNKKVFMLTPWFEIYKTDNERKQTWEEAIFTYEVLVKTYKLYDYDLIEIPKDNVSKRIDFIIENLLMF